MTSAENKAVFLSYASQDAEAARRIAEALRAAGVEVWFDQNELVGGDAWDQKIRRQIKECALFVPVISANTNARAEGYFRLEWKLAVDRSHLMADDAPFLFPVVIDDTSDAAARVPDRFRDVQWTRLNVKDTPETLARRISRLVGGSRAETAPVAPRPVDAAPDPTERGWWAQWWWLIFPVFGMVMGLVHELKRTAPAPTAAPAVSSPPTAPVPTKATPPRSEARQLADRAFAMSVDSYDSTLDDYTTADALLKRAVALDPNDGEILARFASLQIMFRNRGFDYAQERIATGREQAERAIRLAPESPEALMALSLAQRYTGNREASIETLRRLLAVAPDHARGLLALGSAIGVGGASTDEALALYRRASQQPKWAPLADYFEFLRFWASRRFDEAEAAARHSYTTTPSANTAGAIAMLHLTVKGDLDAAARELAAVPPALINTPRVVWLTAQVHLNRRAPDEALRALDRFSDEFIRDSWFVGPKALLVGRAHALAGRPNAARLAWEAGLAVIDARLKTEPSDTGFRRARGELLAWLGRADEALQEARTAEEIDRGRLNSWNFSSVTIYAVLGRADLATPILEKLLAAPTNWPLTRTLLRQDPLWDKLRDDPGFKKLLEEPAAEAKPVTQSSPTTPASASDDKSVAVLAFADLSAGRDSEYFSDGISEELINALGKVSGLKVPARTSSFYFKGKSVPVSEIAKQLGVAYVIEGSVQRAGGKVKISARLSKAADGFQVWAESFLRDAKDVFAVEEEIAGLIAKQLSLKLGVSSAAATASVNPEAFELYVQARQQWNLRTLAGFDRAEEMLNRALLLEPNFARGHAALGDVWYHRGETLGTLGAFGARNSPELARLRAKARQALDLDPDSAEAHALMANVLRTAWQNDEARRELRLAIALNPTYPSAHQRLSRMLLNDGRLDEGLAEMKLAAELDPLSSRILDNYATALRWAGRYAESLAVAERAVAAQPDSVQALMAKSRALLALGRADEALAVVRGLTPYSGYTVFAMAEVLAGVGRQAEAGAQLSQLKDMSWRWLVLAALGHRADSIAAFDAQEFSLGALEVFLFSPSLDSVRDDPRIVQGLAALGLSEAHARAQAWRKAHPPEKPGK